MKLIHFAACAALALLASPATSSPSQVPASAAAEAADLAHVREVLTQLVNEVIAGHVNYESMTPEMAAIARPEEATVHQNFLKFGALKSLEFNARQGEAYIFTAKFENGETVCRIRLDAAGKIAGVRLG
ncbi:MAG: DUF3887 domain-containing protein [Pseudomonadota bacterium]|nr:DUF3887 domain-containing protein [Pseudomonadota bacterium]